MAGESLRMGPLLKSGMYLLSLWLLLVLVIVNKIDIPICLDCTFIGKDEIGSLISANALPLICGAALLISLFFYFTFIHIIDGVQEGPFEVIEVEDKTSDHLVFLATYVIPLLSFNLDTVRQIISLAITLSLIGAIYVKTNLFYANPTLSLLGFKIITVKFRPTKVNSISGNAILITREDIILDTNVNVSKLDKNIYFAKKAIVIDHEKY